MAATELSPGERDPMQAVATVDLPDRVERLADAYDRQFDDRDRFLWQWIYSLFPEFTLSCVADEHAQHVRTQKTVLTMYVTVLDDLLEVHDDRATFREAVKCHRRGLEPDASRPDVDARALRFVERTWTEFENGLAAAPRLDEFTDVFEYDLTQTTNAVEYSAVVSRIPELANVTGAKRYDAHNMCMFAFADVDLMYSPGFRLREFGAVRDLLWDLQELARIGNWITTWERELAEGDFSSGVVVAALQEGVVTPAELASEDADTLVERIKANGIEGQFRRHWAARYRSARTQETDAESVDLDALARGMETVFEYHLASQGLK